MENYNVKDGSMPALVLAYSKYKNIDREQDILNRNKILIPHPAFMPGGETIKILSY
jgi:prophage DNA circulation protein